TFTIQENSHFLYPLFSLCTPIFNDQVQLVVKSHFSSKHPNLHQTILSMSREYGDRETQKPVATGQHDRRR
ncbi:hypothetical protein P4532_07855, partial [Geobacillus stearothermophilus]|nr:hypothetical protein [Geobacillus stearothermophilus]